MARRILGTVVLCVMLLGLAQPLTAQAGSIEPISASLTFDEDGATLAADFKANLGSHLEEALQHGLMLSFKLEFVLERPRKYWVAEHITSHTQSYRLSYSSLTRQYRVAHGSLQRSHDSLGAALRAITRISGLPVVERGLLRPATTYEAAVRLSLDRSQLPKPFQLDALTSADWQVEVGTHRWMVTSP